MARRSGHPRISDLKGTRVLVLLPAEGEAEELTAHLIRIGCLPRLHWPIPETLPDEVDVVIVTVDTDTRAHLRAMIDRLTDLSPPIIALTGYEDPSTLQLILEMRATAVIERPLKPFGLLTNLMISRDVGQRRRDFVDRLTEAENRHLALSSLHVAKIVLRHQHGMEPPHAHRHIQKLAMDSRRAVEAVCDDIILASLRNEVCRAAPDGE